MEVWQKIVHTCLSCNEGKSECIWNGVFGVQRYLRKQASSINAVLDRDLHSMYNCRKNEAMHEDFHESVPFQRKRSNNAAHF